MLRFEFLPNIQDACDKLADRLHTELIANKSVLWLLSGGSNIEISANALNLLPPDLQSKLTITLNDERYGPYGHKDSNMHQLRTAGIANTHAKIIPVIAPEGLPLDETTQHFEQNIQNAFADADIIISQLGMGNDGHTAGILPNSPAVNATGLVTSYTTEQYVRITLTFEALKRVNTAYLFVFGDDKREQLLRLRDEDFPLKSQPAQIIRQITEAYVYNDQLGAKDHR